MKNTQVHGFIALLPKYIEFLLKYVRELTSNSNKIF